MSDTRSVCALAKEHVIYDIPDNRPTFCACGQMVIEYIPCTTCGTEMIRFCPSRGDSDE